MLPQEGDRYVELATPMRDRDDVMLRGRSKG
jgi:hypothetical protein